MSDSRELAVFGINTAIILASFMVLCYINVNRGYIPLKCKNIPLLNTLYLTIFLWYVGDIFTYQPTLVHLSRATCIATMSWLRMSLGVYSVISCHIFRIYQYHCIFRWKIRATGVYLWLPVVVWALFPLIYGILAAALPENLGISVQLPTGCYAAKPSYFVALAFLLLLLLAWVYATLLMTRVNVCFSEYRELLLVICSTVSVVLVQVILRWVPGVGDSGFAYNTMTSVTDVLIGQISFLVLVGRPAYHCLVDRDEYLSRFLQTLKQENRQSEYELANGEKISRLRLSSDRYSVVHQEDVLSPSTRSLAKILGAGQMPSPGADSVTAFHSDLDSIGPTSKRMLV
ncbi:hypothetical protein H4R99_001488 [Coemansia sp. RSA 1722]|nr:hypothetical protein LPJ57_001923 [Coemansia sp. RSA 486]KAJ2232728.1 hypothetical protein IWW45_004747 [Coemansia sp. RSA 485]KAJ2596730.1 hypothetical protein GGF39_003329 [Coemansia sp. RSA 1721]KAJ2604910.1 hypothetical protein H4R99_001488 [Coemansia sp. RSA 1722]KAJ2638741.1 hypothetical protein GGF40_001400 [Coemansia sp. RSA 1286]